MAEIQAISIEAELNEVMSFFDGLNKDRRAVRKNLLRTVAQKGKTKSKKAYSSVLHKKTGDLYRSIRYYLKSGGKAAVVTAHKKDDPVRYGFMLAHGYQSSAKNGKYLTFQIGDKWIRKEQVKRVEPRDFVEGPVMNYVHGPEVESDLEKKLQKEIERIDKREAKKSQST